MTPEDLAKIHGRAFHQQRPWSAAEFASLLVAPNVFLVHCERAFALGRVIVDEAELLTLATDPVYQRQGLGLRMLARFHEEAQTRQAARAFLEVASDNFPAIGLYEAVGYASEGKRPGYYRMTDGRTVDALIMSRAMG